MPPHILIFSLWSLVSFLFLLKLNIQFSVILYLASQALGSQSSQNACVDKLIFMFLFDSMYLMTHGILIPLFCKVDFRVRNVCFAFIFFSDKALLCNPSIKLNILLQQPPRASVIIVCQCASDIFFFVQIFKFLCLS